jgi:RsiW-degrading membrane proteinase PrsW (M82 family)
MSTTPEADSAPATPNGAYWVFNTPPGWPVAPPGWQPPLGWQPDPSWPAPPADWNFWLPAGSTPAGSTPAGSSPAGSGGLQAGPPGGEIRLSLAGKDFTVRTGQQALIGRSPDNDLVADDPAVSRRHAVLHEAPEGWMLENTGSAPTFLNGQQVTRVTVDRPLDLALGSATGPVLHIAPSAQPGATANGIPGGAAAGWGAASQGAQQGWGAQQAWGAQQGWGAQPLRPPAAPLGGLTSDEMATALRILFPVQSWMHDKGWHQWLRLAFIPYGLLPLIYLALLPSSTDLSAPGWAYSLYVAPLWIMGFWMLIRPGPIGREEIKVAAGIVVWTVIWMNVVTININDALHATSISLVDGLVIGFNEETTKALPVLLAGLYLRKYRNVKLSPRMGMFLGTIVGLTFGIVEQAIYTSNALLIINQAGSANTAVAGALEFAERIFVDGFQHAVWAGISGFFIGMAMTYPRRRVQLIVLGVTVAAVLHALNDFFSSSVSIWMAIIVQAVSLLLFLSYTMSAASIEQKVRETPLFRGESMVMEVPDLSRVPPPG